MPITDSYPWMRRYSKVVFSLAKRTTSCTVPAGILGRPEGLG